jgi:adenylate cyclase
MSATAGERTQRRLAAILAADVAGYSRLIGVDEEGTLRRLRTIRTEVIDPAIAAHRGRLVKTTGDGLLIEFASVVDALRCAGEVQQAMAGRNEGIAAAERIEFRIGINVGDIVVEDGDIFGDGVNVAARLEGLAEPGGICVSARVHEDAAGKLDLAFEDLGDQSLRNIARPVRAYRVRLGKGGAPEPPPPLPLPDKPSIAVLPFQNLSGDPEQEYFADGVVEDIITALSRIRWLFVIARNSSFTYKGQAADVKQVGRELGVRYVLEGSVRKSGNRVRITAQLIDAASGAHVWADRYDRDLDDIFALQDEITATVAAIIEPALAEAERQRVLRKPPERLDAWEAYQRGLWHFYKYGAEENQTAQGFFRRAIALDPNFAPGHYGYALAQAWDFWLYARGYSANALDTARAEARLAVAIDDRDAMAHAVLSVVLTLSGQWQAAIAEGRAALALNPNGAFLAGLLGAAQMVGGEPREAILHLQQAMRASPHDPLTWAWTFWIGVSQFFLRDFAASLESMRQVVHLRPGHAYAYDYLAGSLAYLGRWKEARDALDRAREQFPNELQRRHEGRAPWVRPEDYVLRAEGLRLAGGGLEDDA